MPGAWLIIGLAAAVPAAAGASILIVVYLVCKEREKKRRKKKAGGGGGGGGGAMIALWPSIHDRFEGSITKRLKATNTHTSGSNYKDPLDPSSIKHSSKIASAWRASFPIEAFHWQDHPSLVAEAVEHGWSTFAFTFSSPLDSSPLPSSKLCVPFSSHLLSAITDDLSSSSPPLIAWEVNAASSEYMQRIHLNPSLASTANRDLLLPVSTVQSLQTTLPLPGPPLGPLSFPQEGYYEITVFGTDCDRSAFAELSHTSFNENEHVQLIDPRAFAKHSGYVAPGILSSAEAAHKRPSSFGISISVNDSSEGADKGAAMANGAALEVTRDVHPIEEGVDGAALHSAMVEQQICAIGLAAGSAPPFRLPGSDAASIGFFSNGRVFMNGKEQKKPERWRRRIWGPMMGSSMPVTVGCGFDPEARRLFFTLNGEIVEDILLPPLNANSVRGSSANGTSIDKSMEFTAYPLFPTIGANYSVAVTANFGQAAFAYTAANAQRVPNPCFRRPMGGTRPAGEDSADLFSMGRIDSQWLADLRGGGGAVLAFGSPARGSALLGRSGVTATTASEPAIATSGVVEADLFEITLDSRTL